MRSIRHVAYTLLLTVSFLLATTTIGMRGGNFYGTSLEERPFHAQYDTLKPSGFEGHAYGILGSCAPHRWRWHVFCEKEDPGVLTLGEGLQLMLNSTSSSALPAPC